MSKSEMYAALELINKFGAHFEIPVTQCDEAKSRVNSQAKRAGACPRGYHNPKSGRPGRGRA